MAIVLLATLLGIAIATGLVSTYERLARYDTDILRDRNPTS